MTTPQTERAAGRQPSNFEGLNTTVIAVDDLTVTRTLACQCGTKTGRVRAGEDSENVRLDTLTWICDGCGKAHVFFDSDRDGYDGRFGNGTSYDQATNLAEIACPECSAKSHLVECQLIYNIDAAELDDALGPDGSGQLSDYFDAIDVNAECASCQRTFNVGSWELA